MAASQRSPTRQHQEETMAQITASVEIAAPPTTIFRLCHDFDRRAEWDERVIGVEMISSPPIRRGSLVRIEAGSTGKFEFTWDGEYTHYRLPSGSAVQVLDAAPSSPFKSGTETWEFVKTVDGTRFTLTWVYQPSGLISRLRDALGRRISTRRAIQRSLKNLKTLLEAG
jgi:uncharacterized protein YndB with AHSA1/START domain